MLTLQFKTFSLYLCVLVTVNKVHAVMIGDTLSLKWELEDGQFSKSATVNWVQPESSNCYLKIVPSKNRISVSNVPTCASGVWTGIVKYGGREAIAKTTVYVIGKTACTH